MCPITLMVKKLKEMSSVLKFWAVFFCLWTALACLPFQAQAAEEKKELSEEDEIALMMKQLEHFKASRGRAAKKPAATPVIVTPGPAAATPQPANSIPAKPAASETPAEKTTIKKTPEVPAAAPEIVPQTAAPKPAAVVAIPIQKAAIKETPQAPAAAPQPVPQTAVKPTLVAGPVAKAPEVAAAPVAEEKKPQQTGETPQSDVVVVHDDAALYKAARQDTTPKSAREMAGKPIQAAGVRVVEEDAPKILGRQQGVSLPGDADAARQTRAKWTEARRGGPVKKEPPKPNLFAENFYLNPDQRLAYDVYDIDGFVFIKSPNPALNSQYAIVTGFGGGAMKTRAIAGLQTLDDAKKWVKDNLASESFETVEIKKMRLGKDASAKELYWVGHKAYPDLESAKREVAVVESVVASQGGNFPQLVVEAASYVPMTDGQQGAEIKVPANFEREEELMLKYLDQLDIGEKLFGPLQGDASGESYTWQSFGETTWRKTNLESTDFESQVGFWTNRVVFKGIRFPMNTVDPFVESTVSLESTSADFSSNMKLFAGLEWRPFARNPWLFNYRPWGGINVLEWIKNYRFYVMYGERKNIKDPIEGSKDEDLVAGVQIFYEWGVELPPLDQPEPRDFSDFVERYFWGEHFGNYRWERTNFGSEEDYRGWLLNSSITLGVKIPGIPLPANPINDELMLMPYMRFEHINSTEFSFPYQNQYFVAAGMRWMPFRNYRFKENEWLSKTKLFAEYVGVGLAQHAKQDKEAPNAVRWDLRFGLSFSSRRY